MMRRVLHYVAAGFFGLFSAYGQTAATSGSRVDAFKSFLASPPPLERFIFKRRDLYQPPYRGAPKLDTNNYRLFCASLQNTDFVMREVSSLQEIDEPRSLTNTMVMAHGKNGSTFWKITGDNYLFWEDEKLAYS